jgi:hypothetical protein
MIATLLKASVLLFVCIICGSGWLASGPFAQESGKQQGTTKSPPIQNKRAQVASDLPPQSSNNTARDLMDRLQMRILDAKSFQHPMFARDALLLIYEIYRHKGMEMPVLIHVNEFSAQGTDRPPADEAQIALPPFPRTMTAIGVLRSVMAQISKIQGVPVEMLLRDGAVHIVPKNKASLLAEPILGRFENRPMGEIVQELTDMVGLSVILDPRTEEKIKTRISVTFRDDFTVESALRTVVDMVGLKMVDMQPGLYITTPANATALEKELHDLRNAKQTIIFSPFTPSHTVEKKK